MSDKNELDLVFGDSEPTTELSQSTYESKHLPANFDYREKNKELMRMTPAQRKEYVKKLDAIYYGEEYAKRAHGPINPIFGRDLDMIKLQTAKQQMRGNITHKLPLKPEYENILKTNDELIAMTVTPKTAFGFQQSIRTLVDDEESYNKTQEIQFMKWILTENINYKTLSKDQYAALWNKYIQSKRLKIPVLINEMIKQAVAIFAKRVIDSFIENGREVGEEDLARLIKDPSIYDMMTEFVETNGTFMEYENFNMLDWFFNKYGQDIADKKYFKEGGHDSHYGSYAELMDRFQKLTGWRFFDLYASYLRDYRKRVNEKINNQKSSYGNSKDTEALIKQHSVSDLTNLVIDDEEEIIEEIIYEED